MPPRDSAAGSPEPARAAPGVAKGVTGTRLRTRYGLLLLSLAASVAVEGIFSGEGAEAVVTALMGTTLLISFWAAEMPPRRLRGAAVPVVLGVVVVIIATIVGQGQTADGITRLANALIVALAPWAIVVGVRRTLRRYRAVTVDVVFGALCLYLLAGMFFAFVYGAINSLGGDPFFAQGTAATPSNCLYFSFTTLTTVGYGDLTARTDFGHTLATIEALIGQIYLVTVVAIIIANVGRPRVPSA